MYILCIATTVLENSLMMLILKIYRVTEIRLKSIKLQ